MKFDSSLTNEKIKKNFDSQFDLVNYLIHQAQDMIASGRSSRVKTHSDNIAVNVVAEVVAGKDKLEIDEVQVVEPIDATAEAVTEAMAENSSV